MIVVLGVFFLVNPIVFLICRVVSRLIPRRLSGDDDERQQRTFKGGKKQLPQDFDNDVEAATGYAKF